MPQRPDDGSWPVPKDELLVQKFSTEALEGDWYVPRGGGARVEARVGECWGQGQGP